MLGTNLDSPSSALITSGDRLSAPLARSEAEDEPDERNVVTRPYPGVDDGFFTNEEPGDPDVELLPRGSKDHIPSITPRLGPDGEDPKVPPNQPEFPRSPGFRPWGWDFESGSVQPNGDTVPDVNVYQHKKTLAQGMMDLALFSANANQLRYVLETFNTHPYYYPSVALIGLSLILQVAVGIGLIWTATFNIKDRAAFCLANRINNATTICVFLVTVINVFISAFGVAPAPT